MSELIFSVDVESDGPIPGPNSMLNFGCAVFDPSREGQNRETPLATFSANLLQLPGASEDPDTAAWWARQDPEVWRSIREGAEEPGAVMPRFVDWVGSVCGALTGDPKPVCAAYPAGYDFTFLYWYMVRFAGRSPFSFSCLDAKTLAMARLGRTYRNCSKGSFPREWLPEAPHTHRGLDDAVEQGVMILRMLAWRGRVAP